MHPAEKALQNIANSVQLPKGIGKFDPAWEHVDTPTQRLMEAVDRCKQTDTDEAREAVRSAGKDWRRAWTEAVEMFHASMRAF